MRSRIIFSTRCWGSLPWTAMASDTVRLANSRKQSASGSVTIQVVVLLTHCFSGTCSERLCERESVWKSGIHPLPFKIQHMQIQPSFCSRIEPLSQCINLELIVKASLRNKCNIYRTKNNDFAYQLA